MFWYSKTSAKINMTLEEFLREFKEAGTKKKADLVEGLGDARGIIFTEMTPEQRIKVMSEIGPKPASQLFNSVDADVRKKFLESLGGEKEITEFTDKIRKVAVADFWDNEKKLVMEGKGTYNWTPEQQKSILGPKRKAYIDVDGKSEVFQGHHMKNVADYPEYAADPNNIQPLWGEANVKGTPHNEAHNGKSTNPTMGYYDDSLKSMTDFTTEGLDNGYPPIIELTNPCDEVKEMETFKNAEHTNFSEKIPFYDSLDDEGKVIAQRMEYVRSQHSKSGSDVPKNFMDYLIESDVGKTFNSTDGYFEKATTKLMNEMPESGKKTITNYVNDHSERLLSELGDDKNVLVYLDSEGNKIGQSYEKTRLNKYIESKVPDKFEYRLSQTDYTGIGGKEGFKAEYAKSTVYFDADGKTVGKSFEGTKLEGIIPDDVPSEYSLSTSKSQFDLYTNDEHMRSKYKGYDDLSELKKAQLKDIEYHAATDGKYKGIDAKKFTNAYDNLTKVGDEYAINKVLKAVDDVPDGNVDPNMHLKNALTGKTDMLPDNLHTPAGGGRVGARIGTVLSILSFVDTIGDAGDVVEAGTIFYGAYKQYKAGDVYGASDTLGSWGSRTLGSIGGGAAFGAIATTFIVGAVSAPVGIFALIGLGIAGSIFGGDIAEDLWDGLFKLLYGDYESASTAQPPRDPLAIDLGKLGIDLTSVADGVHFDLDKNGFAEKTAWIGTEDGFLVIDRNHNSRIDDGGELFGDQVELSNGFISVSGFDALADLDSNGDGIIDENDTAFDELRVWIDASHDGISQSGELKTLKEMGIKSISLDVTEEQVLDDETGTLSAEYSTVTYKDGRTTKISEFWFNVDAMDTTIISGDGQISTTGNMPDIITAISEDETGKLGELYDSFANAADIADKRYYLKQILYTLSGAEEISINSRGGNIDARDLHVIETFMGRDFVGVGGSWPNTNAANILKQLYTQIENAYYLKLLMTTDFSDATNLVLAFKDENGKIKLDMSLFHLMNDWKLEKEESVDITLYDMSILIQEFDTANKTSYLAEYKEHYSSMSEHFAELMQYAGLGNTYLGLDGNDGYSATAGTDFIFGKEGSDTLYGNGGNDILRGMDGNDNLHGGDGNDILSGGNDKDSLYGESGNDTLYGESGNDIFDGGSGNDILIDSEGDDTFVFGRGYGHDEIRDDGGKNSIRFAGLSPRDISVNGINDFDVRITIKSTGETLTIKNFRKDETLADYTLIFDNVTMHCTDEKSPFRHIYGGDGDDVLKAAVPDSTMHSFGGDDTVIGSKGNDVIYSGTGKDTIEAGAGDDIVYGETGDDNIRGEAGRDVIYGGSGDDTISGGADDDVLIGGEGNDTYIFGRGFGIDVIDDIEGESVIRLESGISADDINVYISGSEAVIAIKNALGDDTESAVSTDRLVIKDYVGNEDKYSIVIAGETKSLKDMIIIPDAEEVAAVEDTSLITGTDDYNYVVSGEEAETILGDGHLDRILASFGDDTLFGGDGNDQLFGEEGRDFIFGNEGDEYINGGLDNDVISGGAGKDFIDGGEGDDVYIYNLGDGTDSIKDSEGLNRIVFGEGINPGTIKCYRSNWNDLMVTFDGTADNIIIKNYCISKEARNFELVFANGTVVDATDTESPLRTIYGTNGSEYMASIYEDGITMIGQDGYDEVHGGAGNDKLYGGAGDDRVIGEAGNDTLFGEAGRDYLAGGSGDDTYIYRAGDGIDTVSDSEGTNYISIEGYSIGDVKAYRTNWNNLTIVFGDGNVNSDYRVDGTMQDKLVIENFFVSGNSRNYYISYNGSGMIHAAASNSPLRTIYSTNGNEYMLAMDDNGVTLIASDGYNTINGGAGSDRLYGGTGNDSILGNAGNDYIDGKTGNDTLLGGAGNDTYIFDAGYGTDRIVEDTGVNTIQFGAGIDKESITAERFENNDLKLSFGDTDDRLILTGYFADEERRKYDVSFANGERFGFEDEENPISVAYEDTVALELQNQIDEFENAFESEESAPIAEETDLQTMKLVEDMAGFGAEGEVSEGVSFTDDTTTLLSDQIIITDSEI